MRIRIYITILINFCYMTGSYAQEEASEKSAETEEANAVKSGDRTTESDKTSDEEKPGDVEEKVQAASSKKTSPVIAKSSVSKALDGHLSLATSIGFVRIPKATDGTYAAGGGSDVSILWDFNEGPSTGLSASLRYAPIHVDSEIKGRNYSGIIEGYHLGFLYTNTVFTPKLILVTGLELGYLLVSFDSTEAYASQSNDDKNQLLYTLATGIEWRLAKKISIGPRIYYGFGNIQVAQFAGSFSYLF